MSGAACPAGEPQSCFRYRVIPENLHTGNWPGHDAGWRRGKRQLCDVSTLFYCLSGPPFGILPCVETRDDSDALRLRDVMQPVRESA